MSHFLPSVGREEEKTSFETEMESERNHFFSSKIKSSNRQNDKEKIHFQIRFMVFDQNVSKEKFN